MATEPVKVRTDLSPAALCVACRPDQEILDTIRQATVEDFSTEGTISDKMKNLNELIVGRWPELFANLLFAGVEELDGPKFVNQPVAVAQEKNPGLQVFIMLEPSSYGFWIYQTYMKSLH